MTPYDHATDLPCDSDPVNPESLATSASRSGLFALPRLRHITPTSSRESAVEAVGGEELQAALSAARVARVAFEATLSPRNVSMKLRQNAC